ncbi:hypothetical protein [Paenibacillus sp. FSL H3-0457]|uniref:hypothetical protein n=1 Tax=Paenibacillus sp. FSL H3-0457 TaxID=2921430 RepID=UPI0030EF2D92
MNLQNGIKTILGWKKTNTETQMPSHVVQMIEQVFEAAKGFGQAPLLLDRYFFVGSGFEMPTGLPLRSKERP